ncbi:MAG: hydroxyacid dehydrogenase [Armatimonadetes bacterium]|nr:hydroxyacid dehydrogenase [Armatimonadota bacterium]
MKVLVADKFEKSGLEGLKALGCDVVNEPDLSGEALAAAIKEHRAEVLIVRSTKVDASMLEFSSLSLIIRAGAGYNTIDVAAASAQGIYVANCPGKNAQAVAELAFGLVLSLDRQIPDNVAQLRQGKWNKKGFSKAKGLYGSTIGLVGMGQIGQEMIPRAKAFGMSVVGFSRWMTADVAAALGIGQAHSLEELARQSDIVSVHVSLRPETKGLLDRAFFDAMRPGALFVNTSRAEVVDQSALVQAVKSGRIRAGLDVFEGEPTGGEGDYDGELKELPGVYCTHHIGASTEQAQEAVAAETVRIVRDYRNTGHVPNVVNIAKGETATHLLVVRHKDRVGVLASVLSFLKEDGASVQEMENIVLGGAHAAIAQISVDKEPSESCLGRIRTSPDVFSSNCFSIAK